MAQITTRLDADVAFVRLRGRVASYAAVTAVTVLFPGVCDPTVVAVLGGSRPTGAAMLNRTLVPADAKTLQGNPSGVADDSAVAAHSKLLVPRHLIPANARMPEAKPAMAAGAMPIGTRQNLAGPGRLVPADARTGVGLQTKSASNLSAATAQENVFKEALLDKAWEGDERKPLDWLISLGVHLAVVAVVMIVPLFITQGIDVSRFQATYLVSPSLDAPAPPGPPPPPPPAAAPHPQQAPRKLDVMVAKLVAPTAIPKAVAMIHEEAGPPSEGALGVSGGVAGGVQGGLLGGIVGGTLGGSGLPAAPPPPPPAPAAAPSGPLRVGGEVKRPRALFSPQPDYPSLAKQARIEGVVQIDAIIDQQGNVVQEHAISGSGILIPAALKAVSQWKYEPTYLNGEPYPVTLTVEVTFRLG